MGREGEETSQRFPLVAALKKHNTWEFFSFFFNTFRFHEFWRTLELKCNFPHFWKNAFDLYKLFLKKQVMIKFLRDEKNTLLKHLLIKSLRTCWITSSLNFILLNQQLSKFNEVTINTLAEICGCGDKHPWHFTSAMISVA